MRAHVHVALQAILVVLIFVCFKHLIRMYSVVCIITSHTFTYVTIIILIEFCCIYPLCCFSINYINMI